MLPLRTKSSQKGERLAISSRYAVAVSAHLQTGIRQVRNTAGLHGPTTPSSIPIRLSTRGARPSSRSPVCSRYVRIDGGWMGAPSRPQVQDVEATFRVLPGLYL